MSAERPGGTITRLYPTYKEGIELHGLYLAHDLRTAIAPQDRPTFVANFITSLDGRIAVPDAEDDGLSVPPGIANPRDWRLFQELAVQADCVITTGRYLREYERGTRQEILQVYEDPAFADLKDWRTQHGLSSYPILAIVSRSLDFTIPPMLREAGRRLVVITTEDADTQRKEELRSPAVGVLECGSTGVSGARMAVELAALGIRLVYSAAGPRIAQMLMTGGVLDRLYLTFALRVLGGSAYATILEGKAFDPVIDLRLRSLYHDPHAPGPTGQLFGAFDCGTHRVT